VRKATELVKGVWGKKTARGSKKGHSEKEQYLKEKKKGQETVRNFPGGGGKAVSPVREKGFPDSGKP